MIRLEKPIHPFFVTQFYSESHQGLDIRTIYPDSDQGIRPIYAPDDMRIVNVSAEMDWGKYIVGKNKENKKFYFGHLSDKNVNIGQEVKKGEVIATSGNTGTAKTAPHLHFEYHGENPLPYFAMRTYKILFVYPSINESEGYTENKENYEKKISEICNAITNLSQGDIFIEKTIRPIFLAKGSIDFSGDKGKAWTESHVKPLMTTETIAHCLLPVIYWKYGAVGGGSARYGDIIVSFDSLSEDFKVISPHEILHDLFGFEMLDMSLPDAQLGGKTKNKEVMEYLLNHLTKNDMKISKEELAMLWEVVFHRPLDTGGLGYVDKDLLFVLKEILKSKEWQVYNEITIPIKKMEEAIRKGNF